MSKNTIIPLTANQWTRVTDANLNLATWYGASFMGVALAGGLSTTATTPLGDDGLIEATT